MAAFQRGREKTGGRRNGARHKISTALLEAFAADFAANGEEVIRIARVEKPVEYLRIATSLIPQTIEIDDPRLSEISDAELDSVIDYVLRLRAVAETPRREESPLN
jgi:hypothetical protein